MSENITTVKIENSSCYVKQHPFVDDDGIYAPVHEYVPKGCVSDYKCVMTREMFVEAYNKWIKDV